EADCKRSTALLAHEYQRLLSADSERDHKAGGILERAGGIRVNNRERPTVRAVQEDKHPLARSESVSRERHAIVRLESVTCEFDGGVELQHQEVRCDKGLALGTDKEKRVVPDGTEGHLKLALAETTAAVRLECRDGLPAKRVPIHLHGLAGGEAMQCQHQCIT